MKLTRRQLRMLIEQNIDPTPDTSLSNQQLSKLRTLLESDNLEDFRLAMQLATSLIESDGNIDDQIVFGMVNTLAEKMNAERERLQSDLKMIKSKRSKLGKESERLFQYGKDLMKSNTYKGIPPTEEFYDNRKKFNMMVGVLIDLGKLISQNEKKLEDIMMKYNVMSEFPLMLDYGDRGSIGIQDYVMQ